MSLFRTDRTAPIPLDPPERTIVVALDAEAVVPDAVAAALAAATRHHLPAGAPTAYFLRRRRVLRAQRSAQRVSSGPLARLDLDAMRHNALAAADAQWRWWRHVVDGTPAAHPMWWFTDRHHAQPERYPYERAVSDYASQPRIVAMEAYNALPQRWPLPTDALEAFQAGSSTFLTLAWLGAVCADGLITADGRWRTTATHRLSDQVRYLNGANAYLQRLAGADQLVALGLR